MTDLKLIDAAELEDGEVTAVALPSGHRLAVYRVDGSYYVTDDTCTHAEASLSEGWLDGHCIACPAHNGEFDIRDGSPLCFPVTAPLKTYPARVEDGYVTIELEPGAATAAEDRASPNT